MQIEGNQQQVRVEVIEAQHVLAAMRELGWSPGEKPPALVPIQAQLRKMFLNGGHTNRLSGLREEAKMLAGSASGSESTATPAEAAEAAPLPEVLDHRLAELAAGVSNVLAAFHHDLSGYLTSYRAEADRDAAARIEAAVRNAHERIAAAEDELNVALLACNESADRIGDLTVALDEAVSAAATAAGRAEAISLELVATRSQLALAEQVGETARNVAATATGKADAIEHELLGRAARISELEAGLAAAQAALATTAGRVEATESELRARDARLADLDARIEGLIAAAAKANGRAEAMEHELDMRTVTLVEAEATVLKAMTGAAEATSRAELLNAETSRLRERIRVLEEERGTVHSIEQAEPLGGRGKKRPAGGES